MSYSPSTPAKQQTSLLSWKSWKSPRQDESDDTLPSPSRERDVPPTPDRKEQTQQTLLHLVHATKKVPDNHASLGSKRSRSEGRLCRLEAKVDQLLALASGGAQAPRQVTELPDSECEKPAPRTRKAFTYRQKSNVIKQVDNSSVAAVAAKKGIAVTTIQSWMKEREFICDQVYYGRGRTERFTPCRVYGKLYEELFAEYIRRRDHHFGMSIQAANLFCQMNRPEWCKLDVKRQYENLNVFKTLWVDNQEDHVDCPVASN